MRRAIILLLLAASGGLLVGCGGTTHSVGSARSIAVAPTGATASKAVTKPRALAFARAVNLTAADLPGFTASSRNASKTPREKRLEREMMRCAGPAGAHKGLAELSSKRFELKRDILDLSVSSEVSVARTSAVASKDLAAIRSAHVRGCFSHYLDLIFKGQPLAGATVGRVSLQSGTPPAPGTTGSFGWRVTAAFTVRRIRVPFYLDLLGFAYGPGEVTLLSSGVLRPFPAAIQQRLFSLLLGRAKMRGL